MSLTPQTNTNISSLADTLKSRDNFVICGHVSPDGDCLGSQLGLACALRKLGKTVTCLLAKNEPLEGGLAFLPGIQDMVPASCYEGSDFTFIGVDVPSHARIGEEASRVCTMADLVITIDHHAVDISMADLVYVDPASASTTLLIWELAGALGVDRSGDIALCCYTGLVTDTGSFQFQNVNPQAFAGALEMTSLGVDASFVATALFQNKSLPSVLLEARALDRMKMGAQGQYALSWIYSDDLECLGADKSDAQFLVDSLRSVRGVRVACMLREQSDLIRGSFRAKDSIDVASFAQRFGGGGHKAAAGFNLYCSLEEAVETITQLLDDFFNEEPGICGESFGGELK